MFNYRDNELSKSLDRFTYGDYPEFIFIKLKASEIGNYKSAHYQKIKNEMLARKSYAFTDDKETSAYYETKKWYRDQLKFTRVKLSEVEEYNLELLTAPNGEDSILPPSEYEKK